MNASVMGISNFLPTRADLGRWAITFILYLLAAKFGQFVYSGLGTAPAFIWPSTGVALAAAFLWGNRMISAIAFASFIAAASYGSTWPIVIASTLGNTLQPLAGAIMFRWLDFHPNIARLRDTLFLLLAAFFITAISPTISIVTRALLGDPVVDPVSFWRMVWAGGAWGVLVITPLITCFWQDPTIKRDRMLEHTLALVSVAIVTYIIFWGTVGSVGGISLIYILLAPFFWVALRFSPRSTALALFISSVIAISGALFHAPESRLVGEWVFQTQLLLEIFAVIFLIVSSAIEDRRNATAELQAHVNQLENAVTKISEQDSAKSDFLAILSHELRNPLAPVLSTLELLRVRRDPNEEEAVIISGAETRLHMMGRLLDDLLDFSRVSEKRLKLQKEYVSLKDIAERSVESARPVIEKYKHELEVTLPTTDAHLFADPIRIEQVLVNVLNNAAKYTPEGGKIEFRAESHNNRAIVTIRDNGTGIEQKMLQRIFEPFMQVSHTKYGTSGVGVGLALAKQLVEMHDGTINALSAGLGRGSTFVIEFPTAQAPVLDPQSASASGVKQRSTGALNVLIVDDNQAGTEALGRLLKFRGHNTVLAFSGQEGLDKALELRPDVILLDIGLPDIGGYEVARRLRAAECNSFIIALTGYGQDEDRRKALDAGCDGHLTKPVGLQDIEKALASRFGT